MDLQQFDVQKLKKEYLSPAFAASCPPENACLGVQCSGRQTIFRLWSPLAFHVTLLLYSDGDSGSLKCSVPMERSDCGIWETVIHENLHGTYYLYRIDHGSCTVETGDPYAMSCGCNSRRCMVVDHSKVSPEGWEKDHAPEKNTETVIYELHVKEFSWAESGGFPADCRGKYKAFTCGNTTLHGDGIHPTGLRYLSQLGITHVQIMPAYDYATVDETSDTQFNWGYDPVYYNVPEGSYASDPHHGEVRVQEFKEMVQSLHAHGFRVIMDVVYNHTYSLNSVFNQVVPWYYYRTDRQGHLSNGSACGNDFASEMPMAGKFILDSVLYWAEQYHIDGFRFDLMGLLNVDLMNRIQAALDAIYGRGEKLIYGEPWTAAPTSMLPGYQQAVKANINLLDSQIAMFSDDLRDSVHGHVFHPDARGFVTGREGLEEEILKAAGGWCFPGSHVKAPSQIISYISAHDNHTLWDKLGHTFPDEAQRLRANRLSAAICMMYQGHLFMLSGEEFARTKDDHDNTYKESIELNRLDWDRAYQYRELVQYYRGLIALRKLCPGLCDKAFQACSRIHDTSIAPGCVGYYLKNGGRWANLCILFNRNSYTKKFLLEGGNWNILVNDSDSFLWQKGEYPISGTVSVPPLSALILGQA